MPEVSSKQELLTEIDKSVSGLVRWFSTLDDNQINTVPFPGSWTAGQLFRHVTKSTAGMAQAIQMPSKPAERDPGARINELKTIFLDFASKLQSPEFIIPEEKTYTRQSSNQELVESFAQLKLHSGTVNLNDLVVGLPLGDITKWEMLHFVLFHTQRHLHQLENICHSLEISAPDLQMKSANLRQ